MRILWILPYSPWPATSGGKTRQFHLLRSLAARGHRITLLLHDKHPVSLADRQVLEAFVEQLIILPRRPLRSLKTLVAGLFAPYPLLASVNGLSAGLQDTFTGLLGEHWDVVQIEHSYSFQPYEDALARKSQPFVLTEHNVESALGAATYDRLPRWSLPFIRYDQWRYTRWERRVMRQATQVVAVTQGDAHILEMIAGKPVPVVVNGVDCDHFAAAHPDPSTRRVLFLGNYEYAPNVDAIEWALAQQFAVIACDLPGHGLSSGERGDVATPNQLVEDLAAVVADIQHHKPRTEPLVILGHSMGGLVSRSLVTPRSRRRFLTTPRSC